MLVHYMSCCADDSALVHYRSCCVGVSVLVHYSSCCADDSVLVLYRSCCADDSVLVHYRSCCVACSVLLIIFALLHAVTAQTKRVVLIPILSSLKDGGCFKTCLYFEALWSATSFMKCCVGSKSEVQ